MQEELCEHPLLNGEGAREALVIPYLSSGGEYRSGCAFVEDDIEHNDKRFILAHELTHDALTGKETIGSVLIKGTHLQLAAEQNS